MDAHITEKNFSVLRKYEKIEFFLQEIDDLYLKKVSSINMFDTTRTTFWNKEQKTLFANLFYHARGHFYKFLWCMGSRSSSKVTKDKIIENIAEEFSETNKSHDLLYLDFAQTLGVDLSKEIYEENFYLPFLKEFDKNHIRWIVESSNSEARLLALFAAYERLDNIDYSNLLRLVKSIGIRSNKALLFFIVHSNAQHFDRLSEMLEKIWADDEKDIIEAFEFIYSNQINMWTKLSEEIDKLRS